MNLNTLYRKVEDRDTWAHITATSCQGIPTITGHWVLNE